MRVKRCFVCERPTRIGKRDGSREEVARLLLLMSEEGPLKDALLALLSTRGAGEMWGRVGNKFERFCSSCYNDSRESVKGGELLKREVFGKVGKGVNVTTVTKVKKGKKRSHVLAGEGEGNNVMAGQCEVAILAFNSLFLEGTARAVGMGIV